MILGSKLCSSLSKNLNSDKIIDVALIELIVQGHTEAAFSLLEQNPELANEADPDHLSAAMIALYHGHKELADAILQRKSALTLFEAASFGRLAELERILETESIENWSTDGFQALHLAAYFGRVETAKALLSWRAPLDSLSRNQLGVSPLHAALANGHESIARDFVFEGADVNLASSTGWTPMHYAIHLGNRPLLLFLREHGATPPEATTRPTLTEIAEKSGNTELLEQLQLS
jgi:ankyrin repeat protein